MAASMQRVVTFSVFRHIRSNVCSNGLAQRRHKSHDSANDTEDNYTEKNKPSVTLSRDEPMVICWHPEPKFPYECSKPMPRETEDTVQGDSPLKLQYIRDFRIRNRPTGPTISELSAIFYDTKHPFYPRPRATRRKVRNLPPPDREGI